MIVSQQTSHSRLTKQQLQLVQSKLASDGPMADSLLDVAEQLDCSSAEQLLQQVALTLGMRYVDLTKYEVDHDVLDSFPLKLIHRHQVFPLARTAGTLTVAISNPFDVHALDAISSTADKRVVAVVAQPDELSKLIKSQLGVGAETVDGLVAQQQESGGVEMLEDVDFEHSEDAEMAQEASVVRLVNEILVEAIECRASDIHIESQASGIKIRYRIDGVLQRQPAPPEMNRFQAAIISRLKIMARMNIAEKRVPQDGRIKLRISGREIDVRVSVIPMLHGEGIVMRVLDKDSLQFSLRGLGMSPHVYDKFQKLIYLPHGIVLVTGPTGSGKTTTLYGALSEIKSEETKIITTEDPIEYQLDGINQIQVHTKVGLTFSSSLRGILRHDPDVVLVGEIRDLETAENAIQASLTGHMVFSTLHTNDAAGAFMRLCDMGVEPFLVSSTIEGVMAQRLVRRLCRDCRQSYRPTHDELPTDFPWDRFDTEAEHIFRARGCRKCRNTGYQGRLGIYELLVADEEIRNLANERTPSTLLKQRAIQNGMQSLRSDGWDKVIQGVTTVDEVLRVSKMD